MAIRDLPDMYVLGLWAYISAKSLIPMLQPLHKEYSHVSSKYVSNFLNFSVYIESLKITMYVGMWLSKIIKQRSRDQSLQY